MSKSGALPAAHPMDRTARYAQLPAYYGHREVLETVFDQDMLALVRAWVAGDIPPAVWAHCEDTLPYATLTAWLLRELIHRLPARP